jgi:hypothetical protein
MDGFISSFGGDGGGVAGFGGVGGALGFGGSACEAAANPEIAEAPPRPRAMIARSAERCVRRAMRDDSLEFVCVMR